MTTLSPSTGPDSILTDLEDCLAACTVAEMQGNTPVLIRSCQWLLKQLPRVIALVAEKDREIEGLRKTLEQIRDWHREGQPHPQSYTVFFTADQALSTEDQHSPSKQ